MESIAIIGQAFRLPDGVEDVSSFWDMVEHGRNMMREWPESRANIATFYRPGSSLKNTLYSRGGYFINGDPAAFDAPFFSITAHEAAAMDPQQRWLLETSYRALENAGIPLEKAAGTNTAVYASSTSEDYLFMTAKDPDHAAQMVSTSTQPSIQANRLSWYFDLRGPSIHVNTACSSSMITMDLACQSLRNGQSSMALVTSANSLLSPEWSLYMSNMKFLSPDSRCYSFDHRANGYARGEGVIVLVLKKLGDAVRDGDTIRAVIRGTGSNQDGHTPALPQPNQSAQESLIRRVYKSCNLGFEKTRYVECHGTGTQIGDVTEATAVGRVFRGSRSAKEPLYIGSIKANIGHLEGGSGLASILKVIMILEKGIIPPNALFEKLNPKINAKFYHLQVPICCVAWPAQGLRRISIDSFGFGGANSHIILDDALHTIEALGLVANHHTLLASQSLVNGALKKLKPINGTNGTNGVNGVNHKASDGGYQLLTWSARDEAALKRMLSLYDGYVKSHTHGDDDTNRQFLGDLAYTLAARRTLMAWRSFSVASPSEILDINLPTAKCERAARTSNIGMAFVFTGQGAQYANMGMELLRYPVFQATLSEAHVTFQELGAEWSLFDELRDQTNINKPEFSQPLCTALQIALVELLATFNIFPNVVLGHSSGEIAAAYTVGAISLRSACKVAYHRGRLAGKVAAASVMQPGVMMSVNLAEPEAEIYLAKFKTKVSVACVNSPANVTLSGDETIIDQLQADLERDGIFARKLKTGVAYHSPAMHQVADEYLSSLGLLEPRELPGGSDPFMVSTVTSQKVAPISLLDPSYWVDNLESPVRFADAMQYLIYTGPKVDGFKPITKYLEIGPHGALQRPVRDSLAHAGNSTALYGSVLSRQDSPSKTILQLVGQLFTSGYPVSLTAANQHDGPSPTPTAKLVVDTPQYPFDTTQTYWHEPRTSRDWRLREEPWPSLLGVRTSDWNPLRPRWRKMLKIDEVPWVADHVVGNTIVFPAVGSVIIAMEAVKQTAAIGSSQAIRGYHIKEATFTSPIVVTPGKKTEVVTHLRPLQQTYERSSTRFEVEIFSYAEKYWRACCKCLIHVEFEQQETETRAEVDGGGQEMQILAGSLATRYDDIKGRASSEGVKIPTLNLYSWLQGHGFSYGPSFSLADEVCWDGGDVAIAEVKVGSPAVGEFKEGVVHPGILDSCLQLCPIPPSKGMSGLIPTSVPHKITDAWISETGWQNPSTERVKVLTQAKLKVAGAGIDCEVAVLSETGALLCYLKRLEMSPVTVARELELANDSGKMLLHRIEWKPHVSLGALQVSSKRPLPEEEDAMVHDRIKLEETLRAVAHQSIASLQGTDWEKMPAHLKKYVSWVQGQLQEKPIINLPQASHLASTLQDLGARRPSWKIFATVAQNLPSIIRGEAQNLDLSASSTLVQDYLDNAVTTICSQSLEKYIKLLSHQKPSQRILEVGARRGVLTTYALSVLQQIEARTGGIAFSEYVCSDAKAEAVHDTKQKFAEHPCKSRVEFMCLDVNQDLVRKGLQPAAYDVIFAADILRGAKDIAAVLQNLRQVLAPGGQLVLHEVTFPNRFEIGLGFGVTEDWWPSDRTLTCLEWDVTLRDNGFSGTDLVLRDYQDDDAHCFCLMISREAAHQPSLQLEASARVLIVIDDNHDFQRSLAESLRQSNTTWNSSMFTLTELADQKLQSTDYIISLFDVYHPFLHPMTQSTLNTIRTFIQHSQNILWVTAHDSTPLPYHGIKDGLLRTLRSEFPLNRIISLTIDNPQTNPSVPPLAAQISKIFTTSFTPLFNPETPTEYLIQNSQILSPRLTSSPLNTTLCSILTPQPTTSPWLHGPPLTLSISTRGQLETLQFIQDPTYSTPLDPTSVEIEAKVWGVSFRDVFLALGRLDEDDFGADCAGIVTRVGSAVTSVKPGDRVAVQTTDAMKSYPRAHEWMTAKIDDSVSFEEACAVVIPGMTALQALVEVGRLKKGEKVLVHSAAGGTGQVAVQIAQWIGAEVFATVGYESKKKLLMDEYGIPGENIFRSRDSEFARGVMRVTGGQGVDVVVNSLVGESLRGGWGCLAPYGRMIEIGKAEINANSSLPMGGFRKNCLFAGVDLHHIVNDLGRKDLAGRLLKTTMELARDGWVRAPMPLNVFGVDRVEDAFRYLASGKNMGRIVIRVERETVVQKHLIQQRTWKFDEKATYLVAGGLGGIGRSILRWMVTRGARYLLVPSRSGPASAAASEILRELSQQNIVVSTPKCDVSDKEALDRMLQEASTTLPPIRGCIVATMVLNDRIFENLTLPQWQQTTSSKISTSYNLHTSLPALDFFILLSSISGIVGNPGQANYAAGCTFQDALARHRTTQDKQKAISIDLGVMRSIGVVAESQHLQGHFSTSKGFHQIEEKEFLSLLDIVCDPEYCPQEPQIVMGLETPANLAEIPPILQRPLFAHFSQVTGRSGSTSGEGEVDYARLFRQAESVSERAKVVVEALSKRLARTLSIKMEDVDTHQALHAYGVDSLIAVELRSWLGKEFAADVPVFEIVSGKSVEAVGELVGKTSRVGGASGGK